MIDNKTFSMEADRLDNSQAVEVWRRTLTVGKGRVVLLGSYERVDTPEGGRETRARVIATSYCCTRGMPVASVPIWGARGEDAIKQLKSMEDSITMTATTTAQSSTSYAVVARTNTMPATT